jgi:hypothetical protein
MAAGKKATKKTPAVDPLLRIHPVALELSKAGAAVWLLDQLHTGEQVAGFAATCCGRAARTRDVLRHLALEERDVRGWLETLCIDTIADALHEAERALAKTVGQDARTAAAGAPATEAAR